MFNIQNYLLLHGRYKDSSGQRACLDVRAADLINTGPVVGVVHFGKLVHVGHTDKPAVRVWVTWVVLGSSLCTLARVAAQIAFEQRLNGRKRQGIPSQPSLASLLLSRVCAAHNGLTLACHHLCLSVISCFELFGIVIPPLVAAAEPDADANE